MKRKKLSPLPIEFYDYINEDPNRIWEYYYDLWFNICLALGSRHNIDGHEIVNDWYIYFNRYCRQFRRCFNGNIMIFDNYIFNLFYLRINNYVGKYHQVYKRVSCVEDIILLMDLNKSFDDNYIDDVIMVTQVTECLTDYERMLIKLYYCNDIKQVVIANKLGSNQTKISNDIRDILKKIRSNFSEEDFDDNN